MASPSNEWMNKWMGRSGRREGEKREAEFNCPRPPIRIWVLRWTIFFIEAKAPKCGDKFEPRFLSETPCRGANLLKNWKVKKNWKTRDEWRWRARPLHRKFKCERDGEWIVWDNPGFWEGIRMLASRSKSDIQIFKLKIFQNWIKILLKLFFSLFFSPLHRRFGSQEKWMKRPRTQLWKNVSI